MEVDIPLFNFKDINIFLIKKCEGADPNSQISFIGRLLFWVFVLFLGFMGHGTYQNVKVKGYFTLDAVPFYENITRVVESLKGMVINTGSRGHKPLRNYEEESEKYGEKMEDNPGRNSFNFEDKEEEDVRIRLEHNGDEGKKYGTI